MNYSESTTQLNELRSQILAIRAQMRELQSRIEPEDINNYEFQTENGKVTLLELFGDKNDMFIVHNMGKSCSYCTLWADGVNGVREHLASRAAFVVTSPDTPAVQQKFAKGRGWKFPIVSHAGSSFATDMGYGNEKDGWHPGLSVLQRRGDSIVRVSNTAWGPGDDFCSVWHFMDMLPEGSDGWQPQFKYS